MAWIFGFVARSSDITILLTVAISTALLALFLAATAGKVLFSRHDMALEAHAKLADLVHSSLLAFAVFVLALVLSDVRSHFGKAEEVVLREAAAISRLDRELENIKSADADASRGRLKDYVAAVISSDWQMLAKPYPELSPAADRALAALYDSVRRLAATTPESSVALRGLVDQLESMRLSRFESAEKSVPPVFWWAMMIFIAAAMIMSGRNKLSIYSALLIVIHMAAIGLVIGLILIMDAPFRGETSVSPSAIARAVKMTSLPLIESNTQ